MCQVLNTQCLFSRSLQIRREERDIDLNAIQCEKRNNRSMHQVLMDPKREESPLAIKARKVIGDVSFKCFLKDT